jgi:flagellin
MRINTDVSALAAVEQNTQNTKVLNKSLEKLSTGLQIVKASDNEASLSIADKLRTQISSTRQGLNNANSAITMLQIADQAMSEQSNILNNIKTKLVQASTSTTSSDGIESLNNDIQKLLTQLDDIAIETNYNGIALISDGTDSGASDEKIFHIGLTNDAQVKLDAGIQANTTGLDIKKSDMEIHSNNDAKNLLLKVDDALTTLNSMRTQIGSVQNQVLSAMRGMISVDVNIGVAESIIRDVDYAIESAIFNKANIISQAGNYALSQANTSIQSVVSYLK